MRPQPSLLAAMLLTLPTGFCLAAAPAAAEEWEAPRAAQAAWARLGAEEAKLAAEDSLRDEAPSPRAHRLRALPAWSAHHAQPVVRPAFQHGHARSAGAGWAGLHFWAEGAGYAVGRRSAGYGIECGAALPLDEGIDLTAGYRLAGYAAGDYLDPELADVDERIATPFLGLDFRF